MRTFVNRDRDGGDARILIDVDDGRWSLAERYAVQPEFNTGPLDRLDTDNDALIGQRERRGLHGTDANAATGKQAHAGRWESCSLHLAPIFPPSTWRCVPRAAFFANYFRGIDSAERALH